MPDLDLLSPQNLSDLYAHQLRQTINAYDPPHVVFGEGLQNALDSVRESGGDDRRIDLHLDLPNRRVSVTDNGVGFPNNPKLLFLGGTEKSQKSLYGMIGAGLKVVLFSSSEFTLRARAGAGAFRIDLDNAYQFDGENPPALAVPEAFPPDANALEEVGTELSYILPEGEDDILASCMQRVIDACLPKGDADPFLATLQRAVNAGAYGSRLAALFAFFLRRYTYAGDVRTAIGLQDPHAEINVRIDCDGDSGLGIPLLAELSDGVASVEFKVDPAYQTVEDSVAWSPPNRRLSVFQDRLGRGGENLTQTAQGLNHLRLTDPEDFKRLLENRRGGYGQAAPWIDEFERLLFPKINGISLTIGRIPDLDRLLPGGSRRVVSANGVVTTHELAVDSGQNQEYVRCFDLCIDVDGDLNWGKSQITNPHLVKWVRRYINAAYAAVIQNAAKAFVGRIAPDDDDDPTDVFLGRPDLALDGLVLRKEPKSEQDVIALMFELAGRGEFDSYRFFGLSSIDRYDSRAAILTEGLVPEEVFDPDGDGDLSVVEFKHTAASLVTDLERNQKDIADIDLLVAWQEGISPVPHYIFEDIEHSRAATYNPSRVIPGVARYLQDTRSGRQVQVLLLDRIIDRLAENG